MGGRFSYVLFSGTLLAAAVAAGVATWLEWLPCRGSMLNGSVLLGYQYPTDFSDACLARMDGSDAVPLAPGTLEARALSALLLALGWLIFASRLRLPVAWRAVVLLPVASIAWYAIQTWPAREGGAPAGTAEAMVLIELTAFAAAVVIGLRLNAQDGRQPALIGLWAVASYGLLHQVGDYLLMMLWSDANWDTPPGTGYPTVAMIVVCGVLVALLGSRQPFTAATSASARSVRSQVITSSSRPKWP